MSIPVMIVYFFWLLGVPYLFFKRYKNHEKGIKKWILFAISPLGGLVSLFAVKYMEKKTEYK
ncbi:MAG: hypothetical protein IJC74_02570 [Clostridia bacterium]|nr:hypothetical protein [Clostridia bacterium]